MVPEPADDPVLASCKYKLNHFRIKELKDVLHQLGLPKQGKKQELVDKVIAVLFDQQDRVSKMNDLPNKKVVGRETVVKIVEDTFRKMQDPTNTVAASRSHIESGYSAKPKKKSDNSAELDVKVRCPCGNFMPKDSMIKCVDPQCNVWQHVACVVIPEKPADSISPELPPCFYCEMCRISRADPFWVTVNHPLLPILIAPSSIAADGSYTVQYTARGFPLSRANREILQKAEYDLQVWCILLNDRVSFRMHWPLHSDMQINGNHVRVINRKPTHQLGANGRDDGPVLTDYLREGPNKIALSRNDSRTFCLGIRIAKRRSLEQVLNLVPKEQDGEKFDDALARVRRCVGGTEANNADSDSDIEVVADSVPINLRCPMTASRIRIAGRFKPCAHMGCFDLEAFIEINQRSRKWQCPICLKNYSLENIIIDPYFNRITSLIQSYGEDTSEIDVKPDGSWKVRGGAELKDLAQWHLPDGTLCVTTDTRAKPNMDIVKQEIKEEPLSEELGCRLKLGIRKNSNGQWEISKRGNTDLVPSSDNDHARHFENKNCTTLSSNIDDADTEDETYNSEPGGNDYPMSHVHDLDSSPTDEHVPPEPREQDILVLSDSDDDIVTVLSPSAVNCGSVPDTGNPFPPKPPETSGVCGEQHGGFSNETSCLALSEGFGDLGLSFWECPLSPQDDRTYQMFDPSIQVTDNLGEAQNYPANYQSKLEPVSGGNLGVQAAAANPLEDGRDGALQACTSSERDGDVSSANLCDHTQTCHDGHSDNRTSLSLSGIDESLINGEKKRRNSGDGITDLDASVLASTNEDDLTGEICCGPFSPPQQQRSVRPRLE
ncbi:E3 SUMO-protein ligase SIZ2-like isoform X2 [Phragmites australis]|uniref:E3 SUMO-protein ligase SIZ2-like isoform X2 n=1 Tax=Phragmites australis TaxID=29695 RepID=UPI002D79F9E5|nr:E3 SUMO-protein ligase SIZ2-like isoform X2 [Phragmites australis]